MPFNFEITLVYTVVPIVRLVFSYFDLSFNVLDEAVLAESNLSVTRNASTSHFLYFFIRVSFI